MSNQDRQEFEELLSLLIPDNTPKTRVFFPGAEISPERKRAFVKQFMNLWDNCNAEQQPSIEPTIKAKRQYRKSAPKDETCLDVGVTQASDR